MNSDYIWSNMMLFFNLPFILVLAYTSYVTKYYNDDFYLVFALCQLFLASLYKLFSRTTYSHPSITFMYTSSGYLIGLFLCNKINIISYIAELSIILFSTLFFASLGDIGNVDGLFWY